MTAKKNDQEKATEQRHDAEANRKQPDKPVGETVGGEEPDFYQRQRDESPDGMTADERNQHQMASPGALDQTATSGEQIGESTDEGNP